MYKKGENVNMKLIEYDVRPIRHANGKFTLYEYYYYNQRIMTQCGPQYKSRKRVWPKIKMENGRGMEFDSPQEAMKYWFQHKEDAPIEKGTMLYKRCQRMKLI